MRKLVLHVVGDDAFVFYQMSSRPGGYIARVWPGGEFKGPGFDQLLSLGTGEHEVGLDDRLPVRRGPEPRYESEWRQQFAEFQYMLFRYHVGVATASEVLSSAYHVFRLESGNKPAQAHVLPDRALDIGSGFDSDPPPGAAPIPR